MVTATPCWSCSVLRTSSGSAAHAAPDSSVHTASPRQPRKIRRFIVNGRPAPPFQPAIVFILFLACWLIEKPCDVAGLACHKRKQKQIGVKIASPLASVYLALVHG